MRFSSLLSPVVLASVGLAFDNAKHATLSGRHDSAPISRPMLKTNSKFADADNLSYNWAGVVIESPPSGTTWSAVTAELTVPSLQVPSGGDSSSYGGYVWVGIDGVSCGVILQTGIDIAITDTGDSSYFAWYEWYPEDLSAFSGITISAGDVVNMTVVATSSTTGTATIENLTTGVTVSEDLSGDALCGQNAEWIVEAYATGTDTYVTLPEFGTLTFNDAVATSSSGSTEGPSSGSTFDIETYGTDQVVTSSSDTDTTVSVSNE